MSALGRIRFVVEALALWLIGPGSAWAQTADPVTAETTQQSDAAVEEVLKETTESKPRKIDEVVVTANRRVQNLQDTASSIAVLGGDDLERSGAAGFEDYVFKVPGLDLTDDGLQKKVSVRGISNSASHPAVGSTASPVGLYLNDTPIQGSGVLPDLGLYDLQRIEVLKGPQGTLYGEGAQGGAIKMLLNKADPAEFSAKIDTSYGQTRYAGDQNYAVNGAVNVPLSDSWAFRVAASKRENAGFVDYFTIPDQDANDVSNLMGRLHIDGNITDRLTLSAMFLHQKQRVDQLAQIFLGDGDLRNGTPQNQYANADFSLAALTLEYEFSFATLTSSTSWLVSERESQSGTASVTASLLASQLGQPCCTPVPGSGDGVWYIDTRQTSLAQELRLVSSPDMKHHWVVGVFFRMRDNESFSDQFDQNSLCCPPPAGSGLYELWATEEFFQQSVFGEITFSLWDRFELLLGVRAFQEEASLINERFRFKGAVFFVAGLVGDPTDDFRIGPNEFSKTTVSVTPKASFSWHINDDAMVYALVANGVRSGGTNINSTWATMPPLFEPDSLWTYEVGTKTQWFDRRLTANIAVFQNDWENLQVLTSRPATIRGTPVELDGSGVYNAARAYSRGAEIELQALPVEGLAVALNVSLLDGEISKGDPTGAIADGSRLPQMAELSYSASAAYTLPWQLLGADVTFSADTQHTDDRSARPEGALEQPGFVYDGFDLYNAGISFIGSNWNASFGVRNLTDERYEIGVAWGEGDRRSIGAPRTWSLVVGYNCN